VSEITHDDDNKDKEADPTSLASHSSVMYSLLRILESAQRGSDVTS
jgi:hypothetical protein